MLNLPRWGILLIDLGIAIFAIGMAYALRFNFYIPESEYIFINVAAPLMIITRLVGFLVFKTYTGIIFHTSIEDARRIFIALILGSLLFAIINPIARPFRGHYIVPYSVIIIEFMATLLLMIAFRAFVKIMYLELTGNKKDKRNVIIYGAGQAAITAKRTLDKDSGAKYSVSAFIDDDVQNTNKRLLDIAIYASHQLERLLLSSQPDMLIISTTNISTQRKQEIVELCLAHNVKVLHVPPAEKWINGELRFHQIREIRIEDLLEREVIQLNLSNIENFLKQKNNFNYRRCRFYWQ